MDLPLTVRPARDDRQQSTCINCHGRVYLTAQAGWVHYDDGREQCPDYMQPRVR